MLAYAFGVLNENGTQSIKTEEFENIYDLFATILTKSINRKSLKLLYMN